MVSWNRGNVNEEEKEIMNRGGDYLDLVRKRKRNRHAEETDAISKF